MKTDLNTLFKDLSDEEIQIYELALLRGYITLSMVTSLKIKKPVKKIDDYLKKLEQKKLLKKLPGIVPRYIPLTPIKEYLNYLDKFETEKSEIVKKLHEITKNQKIASSSISENTQSAITSSIASLNEKIKEIKQTASGDINNTAQEMDKILQELKKSVEDQLNATKNTQIDAFDTKINTSVEDFDKKLIDSQSYYSDQTQTLVKNYKEKINLRQNDLSKFFVNQQLVIDESLTKTKGLVSEQAERMDEKMEKISIEAQQVLKENVENSAETIAQAIRNAEDISKNTLDSVIKTSNTMFSNSSGEIKKNFDNTYAEVQNTEEQLINALGAQQNELKEKIRSQVTDLMSSTSNQMTKVQSDLLSKTDSLVKDSLSSIQDSHKDWGEMFSKILNDTISSINEGSTQLKSVIGKSIHDEITKFKSEVITELNKIQNEYIKRMEETGKAYENTFKNNINDKLVDFQGSLKRNLDQLNQKNVEFTSTQSNLYTTFNEDIKTKISDTSDNISSEFRSILQKGYETALKSIGNIYTENSGQAEGSFNSTLDILKQNSKLLLLDIDEIAKLIDESLKTESSKLLQTVDERINKIRELAQQTIENQDTIIKENMKKNKQILEILAQNASFSLDKASEAMKDTINHFEMGLNPNITALFEQNTETINSTKEEIVHLIEDMKNTFISNTQDIKDAFSSSVDDTSTELQSKIQYVEDSIHSTVNNIHTKMENSFQQINESSNLISKQIENTVQEIGQNFQTDLFAKLTQIRNSLEETVNSAADTLNQPREMMKDIWKNLVDSKLFDAEKSWIITGEEMIKLHIEDMISRSKASVFLLVPKFEDLNWKLIMEIHKKGRKFIICTNLDTVKDINLVNQAYESGIELYSYTQKDFFAAYHDNEEILIAPVAPKEDETTAIMSELSPMVTHISSMFADYWRRVAKKYQPS